MESNKTPEISLVIPVLNEEKSLPELLGSLKNQADIVFEAIFCDGGSKDISIGLLKQFKNQKFVNCEIVHSDKGRGRQMNIGARHARSRNLLFLHADSVFSDPLALRKAVDSLDMAIRHSSDERVAGHFSLRFSRSDFRPSLAYYFYECKTSLNRMGSINGDQGFLMRHAFLKEIGGFDESLGFLEDERMAKKIFDKGRWFVLPVNIMTSARRFETEGLFERQVLNAFIMNFSAIGWDVFFKEAAGIYKVQKESGRLKLLPFFNRIIDLLRNEPFKKRISLWYQTGCYVNANAWQLVFALDVRRNFKNKRPCTTMELPFLESFDLRWRFLVNHPLGCLITAFLTWSWFHSYRIWMSLKTFFCL